VTGEATSQHVLTTITKAHRQKERVIPQVLKLWHGNIVKSQVFDFDEFTFNMIIALCAKKKVELENISDIKYSK
jgi:hypothetical protein